MSIYIQSICELHAQCRKLLLKYLFENKHTVIIWFYHYCDVIMTTIASQIASLAIVYSIIYSDAGWKKTSKLRVTGLCAVNSSMTGEFPAQRASNAENGSIWWRHHDNALIFADWMATVWCFLISAALGGSVLIRTTATTSAKAATISITTYGSQTWPIYILPHTDSVGDMTIIPQYIQGYGQGLVFGFFCFGYICRT